MILFSELSHILKKLPQIFSFPSWWHYNIHSFIINAFVRKELQLYIASMLTYLQLTQSEWPKGDFCHSTTCLKLCMDHCCSYFLWNTKMQYKAPSWNTKFHASTAWNKTLLLYYMNKNWLAICLLRYNKHGQPYPYQNNISELSSQFWKRYTFFSACENGGP